MKKILVTILIVFLLCLGLTPVLTGASPPLAAYTPTEKITLAPFIHVTNSTVSLSDGIGYVDSVVTINNGVLNGTYTNTTETNIPPSTRTLNWISVYGSSQITINNTNNMSTVTLYVYGSSQVTIINSTLSNVYTYNSSMVTANKCNITGYMVAHDNSRIYLSESRLPFDGLTNF